MSKFNLIFSGEINDDFDLEVVKKNFKTNFRLSDIQTKYIFSGKEIIIKRNLTQKMALQYALLIDQIGGICYFETIVEEAQLPPGVVHNRRKIERRKRTERRLQYRAGIINRRVSVRRKKPG